METMYLQLLLLVSCSALLAALSACEDSDSVVGGCNGCDSRKVVTAHGWRAIGSVPIVTIQDTVRHVCECLRRCQTVDARCQLVSFDLINETCVGFMTNTSPIFRRDVDAVVASLTDKTADSVDGLGFCAGESVEQGMGVNVVIESTANIEVCRSLCIIHPKCVHAEILDKRCVFTMCTGINVVEVKQWKADEVAGSVPLGEAPNNRTCLAACQSTEHCRFVSYNKDTRKCIGYTETANPLFSPDPPSSLLSASGKQMAKQPNVDYIGYDIWVGGQRVVSGTSKVDPEICAQLCSVHPRCTLSTFNKIDLHCWLKDKTPNPRFNASEAISYVVVK